MEIVHRRAKAMIDGLGSKFPRTRYTNAYYGLIDFEFWARKNIGQEAVDYLKKNVQPARHRLPASRGSRDCAADGGGFEAPDWSLRVSLANLPDEAYEEIGRWRAVDRARLSGYL